MAVSRHEVTIGVVIPAAGRGTRAGQGCQKAYRRLEGDTVLNRVVKSFRAWNATCPIVVVHHEEDTELLEACIDRDANVYTTTGGSERQASVLEGLRLLCTLKESPSHVFIHDAARPFTSHRILNDVLELLCRDSSVGVIPALAVSDTLKKTDSNGVITATVPRSGLFRAQTPQAFLLETILLAHEAASAAGFSHTDDASLFEEAGLPVQTVPGDENNIKLTYASDFEQGARILREYTSTTAVPDVRVGHGYDTHSLVPGHSITLCGVEIPHTATLLGHSDADVGLHALTNALLGTICADDIGSHFPPGDPQWKGASSGQFIQHAVQLVTHAGGVITHCDVSLVCEKPRISHHRGVMRDSIASLVGLDRSRVSLKAGTNERNGFVGREEGIIAFATATAVFPNGH